MVILGSFVGARSSVTMAASMLRRSRVIDYASGKATIRNRAGLQAPACDCYRIVRHEGKSVRAK